MRGGTEADLARRIENYWRERGYLGIEAFVASVSEPTGNGGIAHYTAVRSNIGPTGFPPRTRLATIGDR